MKFSEKLLRELVNPNIGVIKLCDQLTKAGLEVEDIYQISGKFENIKVGEIVNCFTSYIDKTIMINIVNIGSSKLLKIFSYAKNCRIGLKVAVATVHSVFPNNIKINLIKLGTEISDGVLCSFFELGMVANCRKDIIELPQYAVIGLDIKQYFSINDNTIKLNVTSNRSGNLGILGVARDVCAINNIPQLKLNNLSNVPVISDIIKIIIQENKKCPSYLGRIIKNVNINNKTPFWMQEKLLHCHIDLGVNVIDDILNYVSIIFGKS